MSKKIKHERNKLEKILSIKNFLTRKTRCGSGKCINNK